MTQLNFPPMPGPSTESLTQRQELFKFMQNNHLRWMRETNDTNIKELHRTLADQLRVVAEQYKANVEFGEGNRVIMLIEAIYTASGEIL